MNTPQYAAGSGLISFCGVGESLAAAAVRENPVLSFRRAFFALGICFCPNSSPWSPRAAIRALCVKPFLFFSFFDVRIPWTYVYQCSHILNVSSKDIPFDYLSPPES
jgi:hypothetical protein